MLRLGRSARTRIHSNSRCAPVLAEQLTLATRSKLLASAIVDLTELHLFDPCGFSVLLKAHQRAQR